MATGDQIVAAARRYEGVPYVWGGTNPAVGLDCSGLTQLVARDCGISIPRVTGLQQSAGVPVLSMAQAQPGDLVFFGAPVSGHVGIYVGGGRMIDAPHSGTVVQEQAVWATPDFIRRIATMGGTVSGSSSSGGGFSIPGAVVGGLFGPLGPLVGGLTGGAVASTGGAAIKAGGGVLGGIDAVGAFAGALAQRNTWVRVLQVVGGAALMVGGISIIGHGVIGDVATQLVPGGTVVKAAAGAVK